MSRREEHESHATVIWTGVALVTLGVVALKQLGVLEHLPDPPGRLFASDKLTESAMAHPIGVPDSLPGIASYGTTMALAIAAQSNDRPRRWLGWKLMIDGGMAGFNVVRQVARFGRICTWCTGTALATAGMVWSGRAEIARAAGLKTR